MPEVFIVFFQGFVGGICLTVGVVGTYWVTIAALTDAHRRLWEHRRRRS